MYVYYNILCGFPGKLYSHINDDIQQCKKMSHQLFGSQPKILSSEHGKKIFFKCWTHNIEVHTHSVTVICSYGLSIGFANDEITSPDNGCVRPYTDIPLSDQLGVERMSSLQSNCFSVMIVLFMVFLASR